MSGALALYAVTRKLQELIYRACQGDTVLRGVVLSETEIVLDDPARAAKDAANKVSLWLYRVSEDEFVRNHPVVPEEPTRRQFPPLALNLHYLVTPMTGAAWSDQVVLGRTMQILNDNAVLRIDDEDNQVVDEIQVLLGRPDLGDLTRIWEALHEPYRLSVSYLARVVRIDSTRFEEHPIVWEATAKYTTRVPAPPDVADVEPVD
ncbi:Protein of unknown function (DUF4255) [Streptoalloteichus tenebrarius]|uniref:Pvc16 N-terminal domain-containing protein n=1 Tax=Streptoalloteichus tenebrarius (strain ATCC 17920 / DSM 40477 / JCM 4838 / CBS 697.72 / NBRC 16177 / NCIMB 11028 / NRRL B-12390 / A12253. 1 / ISP 5477) TaxID=1933 RepID=A0ABT1HNT6_STRSD|nr:DUF4255 domain-containing protein [Streptoalloteichus tenebrarius]MCP2257184.1 Protein of unknown function (DUF4255) [Streptoalloteichus tenebrarius]BFE98818.1 hypothetical protein GCM10020241_04940 [Streptoalloteichus tenebrarius]